MPKIVSGTYNGTGAAVYVCCGFIPDEVEVVSLEDAAAARVVWSRNYRSADMSDGYLDTNGATAHTLYTSGTGIQPYYGGDVMTSSNQTSTGYGEGVYLGRITDMDLNDARHLSNLNYPAGDGEGATIDTWTLDTSANRTGSFNVDIDAAPWIGEGSVIIIDVGGTQKNVVRTFIEAVSASAGSAADEVTLTTATGSGLIRYIGPSYDYVPVPLTKVTPAGFVMNATSVINVNDETQYFKAIKYDDVH